MCNLIVANEPEGFIVSSVIHTLEEVRFPLVVEAFLPDILFISKDANMAFVNQVKVKGHLK